MKPGGRRRGLPAALTGVLLLPLPALLLLLGSAAPAAASSPGDWSITGAQSLTDTLYRANGSIVVEPGGVLTVTNSTIEFNLTVEGGYNITVRQGGRLVLNSSVVRAAHDAFNDTLHYNFLVAGRLEVRGSDISDLRGDSGLGGLEIEGGDALIEDSTIHHNRYFGLFLKSGSPVVRRTVFEANVVAVSVLPGATPVLEDLVIRNSTSFGLKVAQANPTVRNLTVTGSAGFAVGAIGGMLHIDGCQILGGTVGVDAVAGAHVAVDRCTLRQVGTGLRAQDSTLAFSNGSIFSAAVGVNVTSTSATVSANRFTDVVVGVKVGGTLNGVFGGEAVGNDFNGTGTAFEIHLPAFFIENNTYGPLVGRLRVFHEVTFVIVDKSGAPVARAGVTVTAADGARAFAGTTDEAGKVTATLEEYREGPDGARTTLTPHAVEIVRSGAVTRTEVNATGDTTLTIELKDPADANTPLGVSREGLLLIGAVLLVLGFVALAGVRARSRARKQARRDGARARGRKGPRSGR